MDLETLKSATYHRYWAGTKGETTALINATDVVSFLGPGRDVRSLRRVDIDRLIAHLKGKGNTNSTINRKLSSLSKMLRLAYNRGIIESTFAIERMPENEHRTRWISREEEERVLSYFPEGSFMRDFIIVALDTGLRVSEMLALTPKHVDFERGWVHLWKTKNGRERSVPMTKRVQEVLRRRIPGLFGDGLTQEQIRYQWDKMKDALGLGEDREFVPHCLRHTFCSRLAQAGVDVAQIQKLAGHSSINVTMRYSHLCRGTLETAMKVLER